MKSLTNTKGFTLIELMIVVAIVAILAAIAIPNFVSMQLRSKRSELTTNVDGARTAEKAYAHEWDTFTACSARPAAMPIKTQVAFGQTLGDRSDWDLLGWMPDGLVRAQYRLDVNIGSSTTQNFSAQAYSDIDGNGTVARVVADTNVKARMITLNSIY